MEPFSVVLNELTKAPFEPMKDTDLKHLTLNTAFLLALASGKRSSKTHAWVANKVSTLGQGKGSLVPFFRFHSKTMFSSVSPVTIPALTTIIDRQFKKTGPCVQYGPRGIIGIEPKTREGHGPYFIFPSLKDIPHSSVPLLSLLG